MCGVVGTEERLHPPLYSYPWQCPWHSGPVPFAIPFGNHLGPSNLPIQMGLSNPFHFPISFDGLRTPVLRFSGYSDACVRSSALVRYTRLWYSYELTVQQWIHVDIYRVTISIYSSCSLDGQTIKLLLWFYIATPATLRKLETLLF